MSIALFSVLFFTHSIILNQCSYTHKFQTTDFRLENNPFKQRPKLLPQPITSPYLLVLLENTPKGRSETSFILTVMVVLKYDDAGFNIVQNNDRIVELED